MTYFKINISEVNTHPHVHLTDKNDNFYLHILAVKCLNKRDTKMYISSCPCCCGIARVFAVIIEDVKMWQIGCTICGLTTEYDHNKEFLLQQWNTRKQLENHKKWLTLLLVIMLIAGMMTFFCGYFVAMKSFIPIYGS